MRRLRTRAILLVALSLGLAACGPVRASVVIEWTTANEVNTAGFNLYRGETPDGPFTQINASLIPASSDPLTGGDYRFEDTSVQPGRTYYYQLEDVEYSGATTRHGPVQSTAPGLDPALAVGLAALAALVVVGAAAWWSRRSPATLPKTSNDPENQAAGL
jgi:hypothetical protein